MCFGASRFEKRAGHFTKIMWLKFFISLALKHYLSDKSVVTSNRPILVNMVIEKLTKINSFYSYVTIENDWEDLSEQSDPALWKILTNKNARE